MRQRTNRSAKSLVTVLFLTLLNLNGESLPVSRLMAAEPVNDPAAKVLSKMAGTTISTDKQKLVSLVKLHPLQWQINRQPMLGTYAGGADKLEELKCESNRLAPTWLSAFNGMVFFSAPQT